MVSMKSIQIEKYTTQDWSSFFNRLVRKNFNRPVATPKAIIKKQFGRLLKDVDNPWMLCLVMEFLLDGRDSFVMEVGPNEKLLTLGVVNTTVKRMGGYDQPWEAMYYRRFAKDQAEAISFDGAMSFLEDAVNASPGSMACVGELQFASWSVVIEATLDYLCRLVDEIKERFRKDGPQEETNLPKIGAVWNFYHLTNIGLMV